MIATTAVIVEFSTDGLRVYDLVNEKIEAVNGMIQAPTFTISGVTPNWNFIKEFKQVL